MPLAKLNHPDRMRLMRFVCSFAWADLEVHEKERALVKRMVRALRLDDEEKQRVEGWLTTPPRPEEVDPATVPHAHRELFLDAMRAMAVADGHVSPEEAASLSLLEQLLQ
jgi:uncharacterized membrane protein YebE (DUF533 family)